MSENEQFVMQSIEDMTDVREMSEVALANVATALVKRSKKDGLTDAEEEILDLSCEFISVVKLVQSGVDFDAAVAKFQTDHTWRLSLADGEIEIEADFEVSL